MLSKDPIDQVIQSIYEIGRILRQKAMLCAPQSGMNMGQFHALVVIGDQPGITMKELANAMHITSPSATALVNRLVRVGWLERRHDDVNRKLVRLRLSRGGKSVLQRQYSGRMDTMREFLSQLTSAELVTLEQLHQKLLSPYQRAS